MLLTSQELNGSVAVAERALERVARGDPPFEPERGVPPLDVLEVRRDLDQQMGLAVRRILQRRPVAVSAQQVADALALRVVKCGRTVLAAQALVRAIHADRPLDVE